MALRINELSGSQQLCSQLVKDSEGLAGMGLGWQLCGWQQWARGRHKTGCCMGQNGVEGTEGFNLFLLQADPSNQDFSSLCFQVFSQLPVLYSWL